MMQDYDITSASMDALPDSDAWDAEDTDPIADRMLLNSRLTRALDDANASENSLPDPIVEVVGLGDGTMNVKTASGMRWHLTEAEYLAWPRTGGSLTATEPPLYCDHGQTNRATMDTTAMAECWACPYPLAIHIRPGHGEPDPNGGCPADELDAMRRWGLV